MTFSYFIYKTVGAFLTPPGIFVTVALLGGLLFFRKSERKGGKTLLFAFGAKKQGPEKGDGHKNPRRSQKSSDCLVEKIGKRHSP